MTEVKQNERFKLVWLSPYDERPDSFEHSFWVAYPKVNCRSKRWVEDICCEKKRDSELAEAVFCQKHHHFSHLKYLQKLRLSIP